MQDHEGQSRRPVCFSGGLSILVSPVLLTRHTHEVRYSAGTLRKTAYPGAHMTLKLQIASILCLVLMAPTPLAAQLERDAPGDRGVDEPSPFDESAPTLVRGQVIADNPSRLVHPIPVRLESFGQPLDTVFTDGNGNFVFDNVQPGNIFYVVIEEDGFRPVRERADFGPVSAVSAGLPIVIFLESVDTTDDSITDAGAVDLNQLISDIPREAVEAFQKAAEESRDGNYERSAERLEEATEIAPDFYEAQNALGVEYQKLGHVHYQMPGINRKRTLFAYSA